MLEQPHPSRTANRGSSFLGCGHAVGGTASWGHEGHVTPRRRGSARYLQPTSFTLSAPCDSVESCFLLEGSLPFDFLLPVTKTANTEQPL